MTASELARRLITLICAGRNRMDMIRRELPRTNDAGWVGRPYRIILVEGSPFRGSSAVIGAAVQKDVTGLIKPLWPWLVETAIRCGQRLPT
jgi:hypothetical protein